MKYITQLLVAASFLCSGLSSAQTLPWLESLESAQKTAARKDQPLLLFFTARDSGYAKHVEEWLENPEMRSLAGKMVLVRLYLSGHEELANLLGVNRAGTIMIYRSDGTGIAKLTDLVTPDDLKSQITKALESKAITAAATPNTLGPLTTSSEYLQLPKGKQVGAPITRNANDGTTLSLGLLEKNKKYVLQLKGVFGTKRNQVASSDALYNFFLPDTPNRMTTCTTVRFAEGDKYINSYFKKLNAAPPPYTLAHTYDVPVTGNGKELKLYMYEKNERNYSDNSGSVTFTLFEAAPDQKQ